MAHLAACGCRCSSLVVVPPCTRCYTCRSVLFIRLLLLLRICRAARFVPSLHQPASHCRSLDRAANTLRPSTILVARRCLRRPFTRIRSDERSSTATSLNHVHSPPSAHNSTECCWRSWCALLVPLEWSWSHALCSRSRRRLCPISPLASCTWYSRIAFHLPRATILDQSRKGCCFRVRRAWQPSDGHLPFAQQPPVHCLGGEGSRCFRLW